MSVESMSDQGQTLGYPSGKVVGVVNTQSQFAEVVAALERVGFDSVTSTNSSKGTSSSPWRRHRAGHRRRPTSPRNTVRGSWYTSGS